MIAIDAVVLAARGDGHDNRVRRLRRCRRHRRQRFGQSRRRCQSVHRPRSSRLSYSSAKSTQSSRTQPPDDGGSATSCSELDPGTCTNPEQVAGEIKELSDGRQSEMDTVSVLMTPDAKTAAMKSALLDALSNSHSSDVTYYQLVSAMTQCPATGRPHPTLDTDSAASDAKDTFIRLYNDLAKSYGLSTWQAADL